jgi:hypothetical protein
MRRAAAPAHSEEFKECVALQAQYILDRFGKFPGTVPSMIPTIICRRITSTWSFTISSSNQAPICERTRSTWHGGTADELENGEQKQLGPIAAPVNSKGNRERATSFSLCGDFPNALSIKNWTHGRKIDR